MPSKTRRSAGALRATKAPKTGGDRPAESGEGAEPACADRRIHSLRELGERSAADALVSIDSLHALVSATSDVVYRMSPDWSEMLFLQGGNFIADTALPSRAWLDTYIHPDDQPRVMDAVRAAIRAKSVFQLEHRVRRMDGTLGWVFSRAVPLKDEHGEIIEWFGAASDVTERKETERALREREEQLRLATDAAEVGLWDVDVITDKLFWPPRVKAMFGISPDVPVSMADFYSGLHPQDRERASEAFAAAVDPVRRALYDVEYRTVGKEDGLVRWVAAKGRGIFDSTGRCVRVIGTAIDITARRGIEGHLASLAREREQLLQAERAARAEAEAANRLKDEFLATVSHELRTPLSTVVSWSRVLQKKYEGADAQLQRGLSVIVDNARLQAQIISDLLDMSRIVSGKIQLELIPTDLGQLVETAVEGQRPSADAKRLRVSIASEGEPIIVEVDATRMQQVLWNLLSNAIKFTPEAGGVAIEVRQAGAWAELVVRDTGIGIPARFLPHVFDRFRQAEGGTGRRFGGLGLGLAIVKQLVELHGGVVEAGSDGEGCGSAFTVRLPLKKRHRNGRGAPAADVEPVIGHALSGMRILAVEDDAAMLELLTRVLTEYGAEVTNASSAAAALEALSDSGRFDLMLSDIGLPEMDGYELMRRVREKYGADELPAIAVTAFSREQDRARAIEAGFQAYLVKPYEVAKVIGLARRLRREPNT